METKMYRQGDVLLKKVEGLPKFSEWSAPKQVADGIVAEGEATGHHHRVTGEANVIRGGVQVRENGWTNTVPAMFVTVAGPAQLVHEEHAALDLEPGVYEVMGQREYVPGRQRRVYD
jgi:hypothetical protein